MVFEQLQRLYSERSTKLTLILLVSGFEPLGECFEFHFINIKAAFKLLVLLPTFIRYFFAFRVLF